MIGIVARGVEQTRENLTRGAKAAGEMDREVVIQGSKLAYAAVIRHLNGTKGWDPFWGATSPSGPFLGARHGTSGGTLSRITPGAPHQEGDRWVAAVGSPDAHVLLHEEGGDVPGPNIIPTAAAQRPGSGTLQWPTVSEAPGAFVWPNRRQLAGSLAGHKRWIARAAGGGLELLALIHPEPVHHRRRGMFEAAGKDIEPELQEIGDVQATRVLEAANGG